MRREEHVQYTNNCSHAEMPTLWNTSGGSLVYLLLQSCQRSSVSARIVIQRALELADVAVSLTHTSHKLG